MFGVKRDLNIADFVNKITLETNLCVKTGQSNERDIPRKTKSHVVLWVTHCDGGEEKRDVFSFVTYNIADFVNKKAFFNTLLL